MAFFESANVVNLDLSITALRMLLLFCVLGRIASLCQLVWIVPMMLPDALKMLSGCFLLRVVQTRYSTPLLPFALYGAIAAHLIVAPLNVLLVFHDTRCSETLNDHLDDTFLIRAICLMSMIPWFFWSLCFVRFCSAQCKNSLSESEPQSSYRVA